MKRMLSLSLPFLAVAASLSATPAAAGTRCAVGHAFVLMLGVGY